MVDRDGATMLVTLTVGELRAIVQSEIQCALAEHSQQPALLDREGLARALGVSSASVDRLRAQGMPALKIGDSPRFELSDVLRWLRLRGEPRSLRAVK